ncbi:MAG TPA: hypothetical protein VGV93_02180, partial [Acidimicrobiales bacterium]|nr:hypothetical protein [Acidimicrobiales bacterium]
MPPSAPADSRSASRLRRSASRLALVAGLGGLLATSSLVTADASSHREAPMIAEDPPADNTDV